MMHALGGLSNKLSSYRLEPSSVSLFVSCVAFCFLIKTTTSKLSEKRILFSQTHLMGEQIGSKLRLPPLYLLC